MTSNSTSTSTSTTSTTNTTTTINFNNIQPLPGVRRVKGFQLNNM